MRTNAIRVAFALGIAGATFLAVACSVDVDLTNKACPCGEDWVCDTSKNVCVKPDELAGNDGGQSEGSSPACPDDKCPCAKDGDCKDPARARCGPNKVCVECQREPTDTCPAGSYCNEAFQCTLGCKQESDCRISPAVPHCNTTSHQCVECVTSSECPSDAGLLCSPSGSCVEGCDLDAGIGCANGKTCCGSFCLDLRTDVLNCGSCGNACLATNANGKPSCSSSSCTWSCNDGFAHCAAGNTGCETNIRTDVTKCGRCDRNCLDITQNADGISCNPSTRNCQYTACKPGFGNCNGQVADGCECSCGSFAGQICCPGNLCTFPGGKCVGSNPPKCQ